MPEAGRPSRYQYRTERHLWEKLPPEKAGKQIVATDKAKEITGNRQDKTGGSRRGRDRTSNMEQDKSGKLTTIRTSAPMRWLRPPSCTVCDVFDTGDRRCASWRRLKRVAAQSRGAHRGMTLHVMSP